LQGFRFSLWVARAVGCDLQMPNAQIMKWPIACDAVETQLEGMSRVIGLSKGLFCHFAWLTLS
jgi:hypothetical protein